MTYLAHRLNPQKTLQDWIQSIDLEDTYSVTLTYSEDGLARTERMASKVDGTIRNDRKYRVLETQLHLFLRKLDTASFKNSHKRYNKRTRRIPILEGDGVCKRHHFHLAIQKPSHISNSEFEKIVRRCWTLGFVHIEKDKIGWWQSYITKARDKDPKRPFIDCLMLNELNI